jgi:hypothetical protein
MLVEPVPESAPLAALLAEPIPVEDAKVVSASAVMASRAFSNLVAEQTVVQAAFLNRFRLPASTDQRTRQLGFVSALAASSPASRVVEAVARLDKRLSTLQSLLVALRGSRRQPQH